MTTLTARRQETELLKKTNPNRERLNARPNVLKTILNNELQILTPHKTAQARRLGPALIVMMDGTSLYFSSIKKILK